MKFREAKTNETTISFSTSHSLGRGPLTVERKTVCKWLLGLAGLHYVNTVGRYSQSANLSFQGLG